MASENKFFKDPIDFLVIQTKIISGNLNFCHLIPSVQLKDFALNYFKKLNPSFSSHKCSKKVTKESNTLTSSISILILSSTEKFMMKSPYFFAILCKSYLRKFTLIIVKFCKSRKSTQNETAFLDMTQGKKIKKKYKYILECFRPRVFRIEVAGVRLEETWYQSGHVNFVAIFVISVIVVSVKKEPNDEKRNTTTNQNNNNKY
ncbi:hypothetical protein BpHYR1_046874 [Brachionus plicatilis]|uniref:Uncharacterized protein n=1 Tax=Brachionus plicatilis TaxID=10195 RepID=A0A3M7TBZ3_BRAPC|nr:hypothetical protein BpHYR1_046874 [Brachionus plicatilis]